MESRTQGSKPRPSTQKNPRPRPKTAVQRTHPLEAKDRNAQKQGRRPRTQAQVLSKQKVFRKFFQAISRKNIFPKIFRALHKLLTTQNIVLSSSREQGNFQGLEASMSRRRISKCVLEDVLEAKDVLDDSNSGNSSLKIITKSRNKLD